MWYKLENEVELNQKNAEWLIDYPHDKDCTGYCSAWSILNYFYVKVDEVTETWNLTHLGIVNELPVQHNWHDNLCTIQIILTAVNSCRFVIDKPAYVEAFKTLTQVEEYGYVYIYCNYLYETDKTMLEQGYSAEINYKN